MTAGERWISVPFRAVRAGPGVDLVVGSSGCYALPSAEVHVLRQFERLGPGGRGPQDWGGPILDALAGKGLLVSERQILRQLSRARPGQVSPEIASVGVITRNRPGQLAACVESLVENFRAYGRRLEFVVIDQSPSPEKRRENTERLRPAARLAEIRYSGPDQRAAFCEKLAARGAPRGICRAAICAHAQGDDYGAARNALMLDQAGTAFLSADDDVVARTAVHPSLNTELRLVGHGAGFDLYFFRDRQTALAWPRWEPVDIVGEHARLLGSHWRSSADGDWGSVNLERMCGHFAVTGWTPRIVGTMAGKVGDSGRNDPEWDQWVGNWTPDRAALGRLEVAELAASPAIGHTVGLMTTMFALDLRAHLPPFPPRHFGEDGVYATLVDRLISNACWGIVAHGIIHDRAPRGLDVAPPRFAFSQMLGALIAGLPASRARPENDAESMRALGEGLCRLCLGMSELRATTLECLARALEVSYENIGRIRASDAPAGYRQWAAEAGDRLSREYTQLCNAGPNRRQLGDATSRAALPCRQSKPALKRPPGATQRKVASHLTPGFNWEQFRLDVADFGRILSCWPEIFAMARDLRAEGVRPSLPLADCP